MALFTVFGGTGFLGSRIVRQLSADGHQVRAVARDPGTVDESRSVTPVQADIRHPETIVPALEGADGAVNAVSLYVEHGATRFEAIHVEGAARLAQEARAARLSRFVHVSGIGADAASTDPFILSRGRAEAAVRAACPFATSCGPQSLSHGRAGRCDLHHDPRRGTAATSLSALRRGQDPAG